MHFMHRLGLLGSATVIGIAAIWLALLGDDGAPVPIDSQLTSSNSTRQVLSRSRSDPNANETQWLPKAISPLASASSIETGPLYGRNGRELDFEGLTAAQYIDKHATAARRGDAHAAYEVYRAESVCAVGNEAAPQFSLPEQHAKFLQGRQTLATLCAQVSPAQIQERLGFLSQAARSGLREAQIDFYIEGPYGRAVDNINSDDPILKVWREEALRHLQAASTQCDPYAMGLLANAWDAGDFGKRNAGLAAFFSAAEAQTRRVEFSVSQLSRRFGDELSPEQIESSQKAGQEMARDACKNH